MPPEEGIVINAILIGNWLRRFLLEHLIGERNLARNTQLSYRDTMLLLMTFAACSTGKSVDKLTIDHISADCVRLFLADLEKQRHCSVSTRNQRLSAIHALARFVGEHSPEHISWCAAIRTIPYKRTARPAMPYLEKSEIDALLASPDCQTAQGQRDHALLQFLYNSGARAEEAARLRTMDLDFTPPASVRLIGKGNKERHCPLWPSTVLELRGLIANRDSSEPVFRNRCGQPITRYGIHTMVERHVKNASIHAPSLRKKRVSPHTIRHATAVHLLRAGVDINTIRAWLGHVSIDTTNIYAEIDMEMKAKALACCEIKNGVKLRKSWLKDPDLMRFLKSL
jgi:site-specific recombinase XerD